MFGLVPSPLAYTPTIQTLQKKFGINSLCELFQLFTIYSLRQFNAQMIYVFVKNTACMCVRECVRVRVCVMVRVCFFHDLLTLCKMRICDKYMNGYYGLYCCPDGAREMGWIGSIKIVTGIVTSLIITAPQKYLGTGRSF